MTTTRPAATASASATAAKPKPRATARAVRQAASAEPSQPAPEAPETAGETPAVLVRQKEFLARVVSRSGAKKKDAKGVVEAALAELGDALARGEAVNLPGLGRAQVNRTRATAAGGGVLMVKLKRPAAGAAGKVAGDAQEGLAEDED